MVITEIRKFDGNSTEIRRTTDGAAAPPRPSPPWKKQQAAADETSEIRAKIGAKSARKYGAKFEKRINKY